MTIGRASQDLWEARRISCTFEPLLVASHSPPVARVKQMNLVPCDYIPLSSRSSDFDCCDFDCCDCVGSCIASTLDCICSRMSALGHCIRSW